MSGRAQQFTRGVLYSKKSEKNYVLNRIESKTTLSELIETYWLATWDLPAGKPYNQQNIPDPCINVVFEKNDSQVVGVVTKRFSVELADKGQIFGIKFRPGGFYALNKLPIDLYTDKSVSLEKVFGLEVRKLISEVNKSSDIESMIQACEDFFLPMLPRPLHGVKKVTSILNTLSQSKHITTVKQLSEAVALSERSLQRILKQQIGVSPKWIIRKYRIQEVLSSLENGERDWQSIIGFVGYFDQSHFIKDFNELIGLTPEAYIKQLTQAS